MLDRAATYGRLAAALPDIPRWLETRSMLLDGEGEVLGLSDDEQSYVVRDPVDHLSSVVGRPGDDAVREAIFRSGEGGVILCQVGEEEFIAPLVPGWLVIPAILYVLVDEAKLRAVDTADVQFLTLADVKAAEMPDALREELSAAILFSEVAATMVAARPVAFCYAGSVTETLWDISIDTLEEYRRQGHAAAAVARMVKYMYERRKSPVWGAEETNAASMALARKLGFRPVDRLMVLRPAEA